MTTTESDQGGTSGLHFCVFVHGLWGSPSHLNHLAKTLRARFPSEDELHILIAKRNAGSYTYDGVETGGERVTKEIEDELEELEKQGKKATKLSVVGYSLGGLIARYAVGLLFSKGYFDTIQPINFTTFATPHLGVYAPSSSFSSTAFNALGSRTLSTSGTQLFLTDRFRDTSRPLLAILADPNSIFACALATFQHRSLYANIVNDRAVPFYSAAITDVDPFVDVDALHIGYVPDYEDVILHSPPSPDNTTNTTISTTDSSSSNNIPKIMARPRTEPYTYYETFSNSARNFGLKAPFAIFITLLGPVFGAFFFANSGVQSFKSAQRIKDHEEGRAGLESGFYKKFPFLLEEAGRKAEGKVEEMLELPEDAVPPADLKAKKADDDEAVWEEARLGAEGANGHAPELLLSASASATPSSSSATETSASTSVSASKQPSSSANSSAPSPSATPDPSPPNNKANPTPTPSGTAPATTTTDPFKPLPLHPSQPAMLRALNSPALTFEKHPVHIHKVSHSHAAIVVRMNRPGFGEGRVVSRHWAERFVF